MKRTSNDLADLGFNILIIMTLLFVFFIFLWKVVLFILCIAIALFTIYGICVGIGFIGYKFWDWLETIKLEGK